MELNLEVWKKRKKELKLTFDDLASITNISRRQLQYLFNGEIDNPRIDTVQTIERALGIEEEKSPPSKLTEGENALIELYRTASEEQKAMFLQLLRLTLLKK